ncbi:hypothetical protein NB699_002036 [Xanthomonas sacchari]|nr:hypothetical protein [Xanthomonas sacchari]MCW0441035.1 hypothetical protein [Xanthomonas sacchari]
MSEVACGVPGSGWKQRRANTTCGALFAAPRPRPCCACRRHAPPCAGRGAQKKTNMRACRSPWTPVRPNLHGAENAVNTRLQRTCRRLRVVRDSPRSASILAVSPPQAVPAAPLAETLLGNDGLHAHRDRVPLSRWERGWGEGPARSVSWCLRCMERSLHSHPSGWVTAAWHACAVPRSGRSHKPGTGSFHDPLRCLPQLGEKRRCPRGSGFSRDRHSR